MANNQDKDLVLKLRFRRILFTQGYWTPLEVELSQYEDLGMSIKRRSITDLDVLGIKYDQLFISNTIVGDCKSGKNVSDANRLFWLSGVKNYFGADQAYLIHSKIEHYVRAIAPKLNLRVIDEEALNNLENTLLVSKLQIPLDDPSIQDNIQSLWGIDVPQGTKPTEQQLILKEVYTYLSYNYWYIEKYRNLLTLINHFSGIAQILDEKNSSHLLLAYSGLERFVHCLLEVIGYVSSQGGTNIPRDVKNYVFGGVLSLREKENFFKLLRSLTKTNEQLEPPYFQDIIELVWRLTQNPSGTIEILRYLQAIYIWNVFLKNQTRFPLGDTSINTTSLVLCRDVANTFSKVTGLRKALFSAIDII